MSAISDLSITGQQLLEAVRDGSLFAELREETQVLEPLAKTCPEAMPRAQFALMLDEQRELRIIECAYNVQLEAPVADFDDAVFNAEPFAGFPKGFVATVGAGPDGALQLNFEVPAHLPQPSPLDLAGLAEDEIAEVREFIEELVSDCYEGWEPELPDVEQIHEALRVAEPTTELATDVHGSSIGVTIHAGTHLGLTVIAVQHDYFPSIHTTVKAAAESARDALAEDLNQASIAVSELDLASCERELNASPELADALAESAARRR